MKMRPLLFLVLLFSKLLFSELSLTESDTEAVLNNDLVKMTILKKTGVVTQVEVEGEKLLAPKQSGYYFWNTKVGGKAINGSPENGDWRVEKNTAELIDVATCFAEKKDVNPFSLEIHFVLQPGLSGFYIYTVDSNSKEFATSLQPEIGQLRYAFRTDPNKFPYFKVAEGRSGTMPEPKKFEPIMDATYPLPSGEIYTKYQWITEQSNDYVYGVFGKQLGFWLIKPSSEYAGGGPMKQDLSVHHTDTGPIVLWHPLTSHYGTPAFTPTNAWKRVCGPVLWYVNKKVSEDPDSLWKDAVIQSQKEKAAWPYRWVRPPEYAANERAVVSGKLKITDGTEVLGAMCVLSTPGKDWQMQNGVLHFYSRVNDKGEFIVSNVVPGKYTVSFFASGVIGDLQSQDIEVTRLQNLNLGTLALTPEHYGKILWQIGTPDRTSAEFHQGGAAHHWGAFLFYPVEFPNNVDFVIGKSTEAKDWNFVHPASLTIGNPKYFTDGFYIDPTTQAIRKDLSRADQKPLGPWLPEVATPWKIRFSVEKKWSGTGNLIIALAGTRSGSLKVSLGNEVLGQLSSFAYANDSAPPRCGIRGIYQVIRFPFDASQLQTGENIFELSHVNTLSNNSRRTVDSFSANLYDCLRLEVDESQAFSPVKGGVVFVSPSADTALRVGTVD